MNTLLLCLRACFACKKPVKTLIDLQSSIFLFAKTLLKQRLKRQILFWRAFLEHCGAQESRNLIVYVYAKMLKIFKIFSKITVKKSFVSKYHLTTDNYHTTVE